MLPTVGDSGHDLVFTSDTMTTGPQSEIWCGSRKPVNMSIFEYGRNFVFPAPSCDPMTYCLEITNGATACPYMHLCFQIGLHRPNYIACM
jgi:hypothetical protein